MGVPALHPKGFWYDPVAPKSRELAWPQGSEEALALAHASAGPARRGLAPPP